MAAALVGRDERSALRWLAGQAGVDVEVVHLPVEVEEQRRRVASGPGQFLLTDEELLGWHDQFEAPDDAELRGGAIPPVPAPYDSWARWASDRWPSSPLQVSPPASARGGS